MKHLYLPLILFIILITEGIALEILPSRIVLSDTLVVPHWVFICLVFIAVFYDKENTYYSVLYALIFGLLMDVVYTGVLGVYMFSYAVVIYVVLGAKKMFHSIIYVTIFLGIIGIVLAEIIINIVFSVVDISVMTWYEYTIYRLVPTVLANLIFLVVAYPFSQKWFSKWSQEQLKS